MANRRPRKHSRPIRKERAVSSSGDDQSSRARRALRAIVIAYLFIAASYAVTIPFGKGPDETAHVRYIEYLAREHRLPVFDPQNPDPNYEFHQPPLYYALALPSYILGGADESAQRLLRFFTLLITLPLLYLTWALARLLFPGDPWVAAAAAGIIAFLPMQLSVATTIGNDGLTEVLAAGVILLLVRYIHAGASSDQPSSIHPIRTILACGVLIGLGLLTKSIAVLLLPIVWLSAGFAAKTPEGFSWRQFLQHALAATAAALIISGWWLARNQLLYGDPLAQKAFLQAFQGLRPSPQNFMEQYEVPSVMSYIGQVIIWTAASTTGVFGPIHGNRFAFFPWYIYFITGIVATIAAVGFARHLGRTPPKGNQRRAWQLCGAFALLLLASFVRFNFSFFQAQARYLFPALPCAAAAFAIGLRTLFPHRIRPLILVGAVATLAIIAYAGLHIWISPQFGIPS